MSVAGGSAGAGAGAGAGSLRSEWVIIGISGVTCGGKTTLANKLKGKLAPSYVFHQDKYFYPDDSPRHTRCEHLPHNNYDILSALDMDAMYTDICTTIEGSRNRPHHHSDTGDFKVEGKKFLIIEGFTVLNYKPILELCDLSPVKTLGRVILVCDVTNHQIQLSDWSNSYIRPIKAAFKTIMTDDVTLVVGRVSFRYYFVLSYEECISRRVLRLYDPPDIEGYFDTCVWPQHLMYKAEIEKDRRIKQLDATRQDSLDIVLDDIKNLYVK